jgi:hypothetical protein
VITDTGEIFNTATADHHDGVFLQIVTFTGNVSIYFLAVGEGTLATLRIASSASWGVVV